MGRQFIDVCAGAGGLSLGLHRAGWKGFGVELDHDSVQTHRGHVGDCVRADVTAWSPTSKVVLVAGGVPCQPFSVGGKHGGFKDPRGLLYRHLLRIARESGAQVIALENVRGMVTKGVVDVIKKEFLEEGFHSDSRVLQAADYGVPQFRERVFIVGFRDPRMLGKWRWPSASHGDGRAPHRSFKEALSGLSSLEGVHGFLSDGGKTKMPPRRPIHGLDRPSMTVRAQHGGGGVGILFIGDSRMAKKERVLWKDGTTSPFQASLVGDMQGYLRRLHVEEASRLQQFPDDMKFCGGISSAYRQIGNAVPVGLAEAVGRALMDAVTEGAGGARP